MVLSSEKITVNNLPKEFKDMAIEVKNELKTSLNSVYIEIFKEYYQKRDSPNSERKDRTGNWTNSARVSVGC